MPSTLAQARFSVFHFVDLGSHFVHVEFLDLLDEVLERGLRKGSGLGKDAHAVAEGHDRGNRSDSEFAGQGLLIFGVDFAEDDVGMGLRSRLENRRELTAGAAP